MAAFSFDLIREQWVPCVVGGQRELRSLQQTLVHAHEIDGLALDNQLEAVAILRQVLLPVYLGVCGTPTTPEAWGQRWASAPAGLDADGELATYLAERTAVFDLFGEHRPFAQVAGLRAAKDETKPVSLLIASAATGNNVPLFSARTEADPPALTPAQAVCALLAAQCWDTAAIKTGAVCDPSAKAGKTTGNPTGPLGMLGVTVPLGRTLAETLLLNTPILPQGLRAEDRPQWDAGPATPQWSSNRPPEGRLLELLTWQARRVRLIPETDAHGQVWVRRVVLTAGDRLGQTPGIEPHTAWRQVKEPGRGGQPSQRPIRHVPGRAAWRGLAPLLATQPDPNPAVSSPTLIRQLNKLQNAGQIATDYPLQVLTVGVQYGNQSAVVEDVMTDLIPLPLAALDPSGPVHEFLLDVVEQAEELRKAADWLEGNLRRAQSADRVPWDKGQHLGELLIHRCTPVVRRILAGLQQEPDRYDNAEDAWRATAWKLAMGISEQALAAAPPEAFLGRLIEGSKPEKEVRYCTSTATAWFRWAVVRTLGPPPSPDASMPPEGASRAS